MQGLVSILPQTAYCRVENIWNDLEIQYGLKKVRLTPYPHFSWIIGDEFPDEPLKTAIQELASAIEPFSIYATGLGIFPGQSPVLYIPVVKTEHLYNIHQRIWDRLHTLGLGLNPLYGPDSWAPHITLAYGDITRNALGNILSELAFQELNLKMEIDNLSFIRETEEKTMELDFSLTLMR